MSLPAGNPPVSQKPAAQDSTEQVTSFAPVASKSIDEIQEGARQNIAHRLILAYILLLAFSIFIPVITLWIPHVGTNGFSVTDARDLMLAMSGTLSGLVGIIGFVMGYYFKTLDTATGTRTTRRTTKKG